MRGAEAGKRRGEKRTRTGRSEHAWTRERGRQRTLEGFMVSWRALAARSAHMDMAPRPCASLGVNSHFRAARCLAAALCVRSAVSVGIWVPPRGRRNIQVSGGVRVCVRAQRCEPRRPMDKEPRRVSQRVRRRPECVIGK